MVFVVASAVAGFILIISLDLFACGFGYGTSNTRVPLSKILVINLIGTIVIGAGLFLGYYLRPFIDPNITKWLSFGILFSFGAIKLVQWLMSRKKPSEEPKQFTWSETFILGIVLSLDGFAVGFGATISSMGLGFIIAATAVSLVTDPLVFAGGQHLGSKIKKHTRLDLSWLSGVMLILIAVVGLFI